jgi:hypothetical protein
MPTTFTPPGVSGVPPVLPYGHAEQSALGFRLFRHYRARPEGVNVYLLSDDTITEEDPDGSQVVWSRNDRTGDSINAKWVVTAWFGGHDNYELTDHEAALLAAAGYTVLESAPVVDPPTISSLSPSSGIAGTSVAVLGTNLSNATSVTVDGVPVVFTVQLSTRVTFIAPTHADAAVSVAVITPFGSASSTFTYATPVVGAAPVITAINPSSGLAATSVVLTGTSFTGATGVTFDGTPAGFAVNSSTQITATAPTHADGAVSIVVTTVNGTSNGFTFTYATGGGADSHPGADVLAEDGGFVLDEDGTSTILQES